tara:strand:- start:4 stop:534 length:531 start_codon:yes stop_codon:yes gene_type:complete
MLIQCKSCEKKFLVPDNAITDSGRLVQCSSCGNKWTQFPVKNDPPQIAKILNLDSKKEVLPKIKKIKKTSTKKKKTVSRFSKEYLKKKYGLSIDEAIKIEPNSKIKKKHKSGFGFYSYVITILVFVTSIVGFVNLTQDLIISRFPFTEIYINYFFEVLNITNTIIQDLISDIKINF